MATLGELNVLISASIDDFEAKMATVQKGIGRLGDSAKSAGQSLSTYVTLPIGLLAGAAVAASAKIDSLSRGLQAVTQQQLSDQGITGLQGITRAAADTQKRLVELRQVAALPGLGFAEAVQGDIRLRAVGISAKLSKDALLAFGNAIATTGGGKGELDRVTVQLGQLSAKGKVLAQDLRPIIEAAPAVATALKKLYGTVDSETISKSLAKQGKSSTDFIETLTAELGKLPKVTGGLKNSLENLSDTVEINLAKLGDSLNQNFDIEGMAERASEAFASIVDAFTSLDPAAQKVILGFVGLVAAAGPVLFVVGAIGAAVPAIAAGLALISGPVAIAVVAITALTAAGLAYAASSKDSTKAYEEQKAKVQGLETSLVPLLNRYDELKGKTALNTTEQAELKSILSQVAEQVPGAATAFDSYGNALELNTSKAREFVAQQQAVLRGLNVDKIQEQNAKLRDLATAIIIATEQLRSGVTTLFTDDGRLTFKQTAEETAALRARLKALNEQFNDGNAYLKSLKGELLEVGGAATTAGAKLATLPDAQTKALEALQKNLRVNGQLSIALGSDYDFLGERQKILESGIKSLISAGFTPASAVVRRYVAELKNLNVTLGNNERLQNRQAENLKKLDDTPAFKLKLPDAQKLPDTLENLLTPITLPAVNFSAYTNSLGEITEAGREALLAQEEFNTNTQALIDNFPTQGLASIGQAIGQSLGAGGDVLEAAGQALLKVLADFGVKYGEQLIALGIADIATGIFVSKGAAEIAAGTGLIAASAALGSIGGAAVSGSAGSISSAPSSNFSANRAAQSSQPPFRIEVEGTLRAAGSELQAVLRTRDYRNQRTG